MSVAIISCGKNKLDYSSEAQHMYIGELFKKTKQYAIQNHDLFFIASARYGLLSANDVIIPYDLTLNSMNVTIKKKWAFLMAIEILLKIKKETPIYMYAGENYRKYLVPNLIEFGYTIYIPMKNLGIGQQLKWLKERIK
jgi:hypothetical protein